MRTQTYWVLGVLVLLIIVFCVYFMVVNPSVDTADIVETPSEPEQFEVHSRLKAPPAGETFATGHWEGDTWQRTVPPAPATVMHEGEAMALEELLESAWSVRGKRRPWSETLAILNRVIAEDPYSERAYEYRSYIAKYGVNGERIWDDAVLFERLQPLLEYHPDSPRLLTDLLASGWDIHPEAAIHYGKEALKYAEMYRMNSVYGAFPERIHHILGFAYQQIGDYSKALAHHRKSVELIRANPGRMGNLGLDWKTPQRSIDAILSGKPKIGPLSQKDRAETIDGVSVVSPVASQPDSFGQEQPRMRSGDPLYDVRDDDDADEVFSGDPQRDGVDPRALAKQQAEQFIQQAAQRQQQAKQRFDTFVEELHQIATIKTEGDFEKFLMQELTKRLNGTKSSSKASTRPAVSADRMRRASQIFRKAQKPAEGLKKLREVDPDLAETLRRDHR
ncbi:tetratricopeptide repeat protein [Candidatus Poribacteria bacterium]|nr:tetratricopeptide repeat protein [Candidatus Poribacteria bacterium]MYF55230.1 tetratricopeptide repeat protein [Candidatus Poribacteria bacterium]